MAHLLARRIYRMLKIRHEYVDKGMGSYETKYRQQQLQWVAQAGRCTQYATRSRHEGLSVKFLERSRFEPRPAAVLTANAL
jgi:hypothetical protein